MAAAAPDQPGCAVSTPALSITHTFAPVRTALPFVIARGGASEYPTVTVRVRDARDGAEGWGEAAPSRFYGETPESVAGALPRLERALDGCDPWHLDDAEQRMRAALRQNGAARTAVSVALHDLAAKRLGVPLYRMLGLDPARAPASSFTIGLAADDAELERRLTQAATYPVLKVKLGNAAGPERDAATMRRVRALEPDKVLRVDANAAWSPKTAVRMSALLADLGVEFLEQPVPAGDVDGLRFVRERGALPVVADESCVDAADVARLAAAGAVDGINLKLAKCGGLREAVAMIATARAHGLLVMCGCMIETSLGITAAAHLAPLLDAADLDGAALLAHDPYVGATIDGGVVRLPDAPGLGVRAR
ncbi:dipeptide epimerase [Gemmatimonadetes bacterium T265]|nr:dipeptide epimerase [Gemmatimonadetes bacterium T265]